MPVAAAADDVDGPRFVDPDGHRLSKVRELKPSEARELVRAGAQLAFEDCGCGGSYAGCTARWIDREVAERLAAGSSPRLATGKRSESWIDLWQASDGLVVYAHGRVTWGHALA